MDREVYRFFTKREHHRFRKEVTWDLAGEYTRRGLSLEEQVTDRFERACLAQTPVILPGEQIVYFRTVGVLPPVANPQGVRHVNNVCPDYYSTIAVGLLEKRKTANVLGQRTIDAIIGLADRYLEEARRQNDRELEAVLARVPRYGARTFREALQFFRILHFSLWLEGDYHNTVGRFDQKMYPYLQQDLEAGRLTRETALALLEDFFLSFCKDYDLYEGIQVGDNGQSLMLGGINEQGEDVFNLLSQLCLEASCNNKLIDPKINLRVSKSTPLERFEMATRLTEAGLGFPQYSNDDVVIPALEKLGYDHCDAVNYTVAACWEFIIPHVGMDVVNIDSLSYPQELDNALHKDFLACRTYQEFFEKVKQALNLRIREICDKTRSVTFLPAPLMEILNGFDPNTGGKYHNYGIHGTGLSTAADSLAAIKKYVYEEKTVTRERLLERLCPGAEFRGCRVTDEGESHSFDLLDSYVYVFHTRIAFLCLGISFSDMQTLYTVCNPGYADNTAQFCWLDDKAQTHTFGFGSWLEQLVGRWGMKKFFDGSGSILLEAYSYILALTDQYFPTLDDLRRVTFNLHRMQNIQTPSQDESEADIRYVYAVKNPDRDAYRWGCCVASQTIS